MKSGEVLEIRGGRYAARIAPAIGGRMTRLSHESAGEILIPLDEASPWQPDNWPKAGAYPLFPYHNRVPGASFRQGDASHTLRGIEGLGGDVMHGPAQKRPWRVHDHAPDRAVIALDYRADADWPFDFRATQSFSLSPRGLEIGLKLENTDTRPMPAGLGWHPYFRCGLAQRTFADARLGYPLDGLNLPDGAPPQPRAIGPLPQSTGWTIHLTRWSHVAFCMEQGNWLHLHAEPVFHHLAAHRMADYLCLEPVSHRAGALALDEGERALADMPDLPPGGVIEGRILLTVSDPIGQT